MKTESASSGSSMGTTSTSGRPNSPQQQASGSPGQDPGRPSGSPSKNKSETPGTKSDKAPKLDDKPKQSTVGTPASEADYLAQQQEHARLAMQRVWSEMGQALKDAGDIKQWFQAYPWATAGAAAAAGFLAGWMVIPSKGREEAARDKALRDVRSRLEVLREAIDEQGPPQVKKETVFSGLAKSLFQAVGPVLTGIITGSMAQPEVHQHGGNGHAGDGSGGPTA